jgi:hypothetical protein
MENGMSFWDMPLAHSDGVSGGKKIEIIEREAGEECCSDFWARFGHG